MRRCKRQKREEETIWERRTKEESTSSEHRAVPYLSDCGREYAIGIGKVKEIIEYEAVTTVPNTPIWIRGVTNLRGRVVPVVDWR